MDGEANLGAHVNHLPPRKPLRGLILNQFGDKKIFNIYVIS
jgi:hypothetical protein